MTEALADLYQRARGQLRCVAARFVQNDAEDIVQDAFVSALRTSPMFRGDAAPLTWVHRIVVNHSIELCRKRTVREAYRRRLHPLRIASTSCEDKLAIRMALRRLAHDEYRVFVLYEVIGYSHDEIAKRLAIPLGTSKWRLARARKRLQESLSDTRRLRNRRRRQRRVQVNLEATRAPIEVLAPQVN